MAHASALNLKHWQLRPPIRRIGHTPRADAQNSDGRLCHQLRNEKTPGCLNMKARWRLILPLSGLALFSAITYHSLRRDQEGYGNRPHRYFHWSYLRLDSDPLHRLSLPPQSGPCERGDADCIGFEPEFIWITPGWAEKALMVSALPAFLAGSAVVGGLAHAGISEVATFLIAMPPLILAWFYLLGWIIDRWQFQSRSRRQTVSS